MGLWAELEVRPTMEVPAGRPLHWASLEKSGKSLVITSLLRGSVK